MASLSIKRDAEDDFVLTISDNDDFPDLEDDASDIDSAKVGSKRKRDNCSNTNGKSKRKKQKRVSEKQNAADHTESNEIEGDRTWADGGEDDGAMASDFEFQVGGVDADNFEEFDGWGLSAPQKDQGIGGNKKGVDIDEIIARRRKDNDVVVEDNNGNEEDSGQDQFYSFEDEEDETLAADGFGMGAPEEEDLGQIEVEGELDEDSDAGNEDVHSDSGSEAAPAAHPEDLASQASSDEEDGEDPAEVERRAAFFAPESNIDGSKKPISAGSGSFQSMSLSRPILKGLASVGFSIPTPIQSKTIPVALLGKDVVGGAVTGSGKTAAFIIPILERLLYRPKKVPTTRIAILMPTRELAVQCFNVTKKLASFTDITSALIVGGFSLREQETVLKTRPDVVIATPGRFIDHMRNSPSFAVDAIEILVLDEADRMLEDGFADELNEILTTIPKSRQTMLFSATMTDSVDKLIRVGLNRPVRLLVDAKRQTVQGLVQEFVRLRPGREGKRLAYLLWLCVNVYTERVIIFFRQKKEAHRVRVLFGLCGLKAGELHGSMSQEQRISSVEAFRSGTVSFLLATDLASRGLDIKGVETVINYEAPQTHEIYLHRVGRTARAGRSGRSCTIAAEPDRKVVKAAVKAARAQGAKIVSRAVPPAEVDEWAKKIDSLEDDVDAVLKEEKEEKVLNQAERDVKKGENLVEHEKEIMSRPKRTWFESEKDKKDARMKGFSELNGPVTDSANGKAKKRKLSNKEKKRLDIRDERNEKTMWKKGKGDAANGAKTGVKGKGKPKPNAKAGKMRGRR